MYLVASTDVDIACHHGGNEGTSAIANTPAGSKVTFNWAYVGFFSFTECRRAFIMCILLYFLSGPEVMLSFEGKFRSGN